MSILSLHNMKQHQSLVLTTGIVIACGIVLTSMHPSLAVDFDPGGVLSGNSQLPTTSPSSTIFTVIKGFLQFIGVIALILIIYGGFTIMLGGTNSEKIQKGKDVLYWAIIGTIIILASLGIVEFIDSVI